MSESIATSIEKYAIVAGTEKAVGSVIVRKVCFAALSLASTLRRTMQSIVSFFSGTCYHGRQNTAILAAKLLVTLHIESIGRIEIFPGSQLRKRSQGDQRRRHHRKTARLGLL